MQGTSFQSLKVWFGDFRGGNNFWEWMDACEQAGFFVWFGKKVVYFCGKKVAPAHRPRVKFGAVDPVVCDGMYEFCTGQMWKLNLSWKWNLIISKVGWFEGLKLENWWKTEGFFPRFSPYRYHRHTNLRVAKFGTCQQTSWLRSFPRDPGAPQVIES